jgi:hypothetical protein
MSEQTAPDRTVGEQLQMAVDRVQREAAARTGGAVLLGAALAVGAVAGGIGVFLIVWGILVGFFA